MAFGAKVEGALGEYAGGLTCTKGGEVVPDIPSVTGVGNCTRCAQAGAAVRSHKAATKPRNRQAVDGMSAFKLGTEIA